MPGKRTCQLGRPFQAPAEEAGKKTPGIRLRPKSGRAWEGVGRSHSTDDPGDSITPGEGRAPAAGVSEEDWERRIARAKKRGE